MFYFLENINYKQKDKEIHNDFVQHLNNMEIRA